MFGCGDKMKLDKIIEAYKTLSWVRRLKLPYPKARAVKKLYDTVLPEVEFYSQEEQKLCLQYALKDDNGQPVVVDGNRIKFAAEADAQAYLSEINRLNNLDVPIEAEPICITHAEMGDQSICAADLDALSEFIVFGGE